ncbi:MAG: 23S rRNA (adenine(2503)-C(2))-methyltransferase RlmN [Clostridiales bacterium]|jgi:23S rRNA (adenine2503-C2)-methyltransferase|nr:23S rRNA (adenine(2503)-C(2))-methyltransferase RlmN [Clostridiales bacterium]
MDKFDIRSATLDELCDFVESLGEKRYRGQQVFEWINQKFVENFDEMTNLPAAFREKLMIHTVFFAPKIVEKQISKDNSTKKFLFELQNYGIMDSVQVEAVLMAYRHGFSVCLSTQAGCRMGCDFCASGAHGLVRNLTAGEIAAQIYKISHSEGIGISNVVLMGMGEPLDNFDNVVKFIRLVNHAKGLNLGQRNITLSTCGLVPRIFDIIRENLQIGLAISLHAPNDQIRRRLMPIARKYSLDELLAACREYVRGGRRITFEYIMIDGVNDSAGNARELCKKLAGINCHINLIPANNIPEKGYTKSKPRAIAIFSNILENSGFTVTLRRELGSDISAACGQLRNSNRA